MVLDHVLSLHIIKMVSFFFGNAGCVSLVDAGSDVIPDVSWFKLLACITGGNGGGVKLLVVSLVFCTLLYTGTQEDCHS